MEDYEYLYLLREISEENHKEAQQARLLLEELKGKIVPNFVEHTRDVGYLENFRRNMGRAIATAQ